MNIEDLLNASKYLDDEQIVIVGEGKNLEKYKVNYPQVLFLGRIIHRDVISILKEVDICVIPYTDDPILKHKSARKSLEYLAAGKPIIVTNVVGKEDFLVENNNCLLFEYKSPKDLAEKIKILLEDSDLYERMSKDNFVLAQKFTWEYLVEKSGILEVIEKKQKVEYI